jgi:hypothetical protein
MSNDESIIGDTQGTTTWAAVDMILPPGKRSFLARKIRKEMKEIDRFPASSYEKHPISPTSNEKEIHLLIRLP